MITASQIFRPIAPHSIRGFGLIAGLLISTNALALNYQINTGSGWAELSPLSSAQSGASYYGPLNLGPQFAQSDVGFMWLHRNSHNDDTSWGVLLDVQNDNTNGNADARLDGFPSSAYINLRDDGHEPGNIVNGTLTAQWNWAGCCADGVVIEGMNGEWQVDVALNNYAGINNWFFMTGDASNPSQLTLTDNFSVRATNVLPIPAPWLLIGIGIGLTMMLQGRHKRLAGA